MAKDEKKPEHDYANRNHWRSVKLGINFSLNDEEQELFKAVTKLLKLPEGTKKEVFIKAMEFVYSEKKGTEFKPKKTTK